MSLQNYGLQGNIITLNKSDGDPEMRPDLSQNQKSKTFIDYIEECKNPTLMRLWKRKIGTFLAHYVLKVNDARNGRQYLLSALPQGYALFVHKKGVPGEARQDAYLWGASNGAVFRSPAEFFFHAKWIMDGCPTADPSKPLPPLKENFKPEDFPDRCGCTYCAGTSQTYISKKYSNYTPSRKR